MTSVRHFRSLLIPVALVAVGSLAQARDVRRARPPNSLRPPAERREVRVSHVHQRVRACKRVATGQRAHCVAELEDADSSATVNFELLAAPSTVDTEQQREVRLSLPPRVGPQEASVELARGQWSVDWRGHTTCAGLTVDSTASPVVELGTTSGRCTLRAGRCAKDSEVVVRRLTITDRPR